MDLPPTPPIPCYDVFEPSKSNVSLSPIYEDNYGLFISDQQPCYETELRDQPDIPRELITDGSYKKLFEVHIKNPNYEKDDSKFQIVTEFLTGRKLDSINPDGFTFIGSDGNKYNVDFVLEEMIFIGNDPSKSWVRSSYNNTAIIRIFYEGKTAGAIFLDKDYHFQELFSAGFIWIGEYQHIEMPIRDLYEQIDMSNEALILDLDNEEDWYRMVRWKRIQYRGLEKL